MTTKSNTIKNLNGFVHWFVLVICFFVATVGYVPRSAQAQTFKEAFGDKIDLSNVPNYANQPFPSYITKDNTGNNPITDNGALLGRVLFYDKNLSVNRTRSCASCHDQAVGFTDTDTQSVGENGVTERHSMRLINARFADEVRFFWDERAFSLENQVIQPIVDHIEMGFSGENGNPGFPDLVDRLSDIDYYDSLFTAAFGDPNINLPRMNRALAQFIRSIQSFDSKYDEGRAMVNVRVMPFPNFTAEENDGKALFIQPPMFDQTGNRVGGGVGCAICHRGDEFDIAVNSGNNGVIAMADGSGDDLTNTRSPTLRDLFNQVGAMNAPTMHNGQFNRIDDVLTHYDAPADNPQLDFRMRPGGNPQRLNMTNVERVALRSFLQTLTGNAVYTDEKLSNPFLIDETEFVASTNFVLVRGTQIEGDLSSLQNSDDVHASFLPGFTINNNAAPILMTTSATVPGATEFIMESSANTPGLEFTVEAFNWNTTTFDVLDVRAESFNSDCATSHAITSAHVSNNSFVRSRIGWRKTGFTIVFPWQVSADLTGWQ